MKKTDKPWGYEILITLQEHYAAKYIYVLAGHRLSLQKHLIKDESWIILSGKGAYTLGDTMSNYDTTDKCVVVDIPHDTVHRIYANTDTLILEISTPELDDIVRLEDDYGRA